MKTVKSLLLGSAAGFVAFTGAQAADLPMAEPVEYVKVCSTYGEGFFYIPGTDTCLQISGKVRADFYVNDDDHDGVGSLNAEFSDEGADDFGTDIRGVVGVDARSETEWGTLRSYIEYEGRSRSNGSFPNGSGDHADGGQDVALISAFVQFAGITAGLSPSFYDFVEYDSVGDFFSAEDVNTLAYTASFGSGFAATVGIEDKYYRQFGDRLTPGGTIADDGFGRDQVWPNVIAALRVDQAWGSAQVSGAIQDNEGDVYEGADDDIGWAVQAGIKFNLPTANEGSYVWAQGAYSEGAISYAGAEDVTGNGFNGLGYTLYDSFGGENNEMWQVGGGIAFQASETVRANLMGSYWEYESAFGPADTLEVVSVEGNVFWTPVDNLDLGVAVLYNNVEQDDLDEDTWTGVLRIERGF